MKKLKDQLKTVSKSLASLSKQVERISNQVNKPVASKKAPAARKVAAKKSAAKKTAVKKAVTRKPAVSKSKTVLDSVFDVIKRSKKGVTIAQLKSKTMLDARQLSNALYKLSKKGQVYAKSRGLYVKK